MLKIKLTRLGKKKEPRYRIVVNEARDKRDGSYIAKIGIYQPTANPKILEIDTYAYKEWLAKGAQPTPTVAFLFERFESGDPFPEKKPKLSKKAKAKLAAKAEEKAAPQEEATPAAEEIPAEEGTTNKAAPDKAETDAEKAPAEEPSTKKTPT